ncbi:MAG: cysteine desulfurase family protein, partial [bacterium]
MIYLDNSATTKIFDEVLSQVNHTMLNNFANSSALHKLAYQSEQSNLKHQKIIASLLNAREDEIYFTSGGTESNNLAIFGVCDAYKKLGNKIITTKIEHPSVFKCFQELEKRGFDVVYLNVDYKGYVNQDELLSTIDDNTIFVSIVHVNNEVGTINDINNLATLIKQKNKNVIFHTDAVQSFGKININTKNIDLLSTSGHKIHAQKGIGFLYIKNGVRVNSLMMGAGQQKGLRSGTINNEGITGIATASQIAYDNLKENYERVLNIKTELAKIKDELDGVHINGDEVNGIAYILSLSFDNIKGEVLVHALEDKDIIVSTGSACSS